MYKFTGNLRNEFFAEEGVNITVKGLQEERIILAPTGPWHELNKKQDDKTLKFTLTPSSGNTEMPRYVAAEVKNGKEKITPQPTHWEVEITGSSNKKPTEVELVIYEVDMEAMAAAEKEEGEAKPEE
ncbi:MAG: hypothetical protein PVH61_03405 [Candidatus Aminicenantes bacterium]|jgi:hypothetical protein